MSNLNLVSIKSNSFLVGIKGLRGFTALAVFMYHFAHIANIMPSNFFAWITLGLGYFRVHLFFIITAYVLMHSMENKVNRPHWVSDFYTKRFFRIAPLFYVMLFIFIFFDYYQLSDLKSFKILLLNLTFLFGFNQANGIVWSGWTVGVVMVFYMAFPVLLLTIKTHKSALICLIVGVVISCIARYKLHLNFINLKENSNNPSIFEWSEFSIAANICFFTMGIYGYFLSKNYTHGLKKSAPVFVFGLFTALLLMNIKINLQAVSFRFDIIIWGLLLMFLCVWQSLAPNRFIGNKFFEYLGERSFSMYLLHPVFMFVLQDQTLKAYNYLSIYIGKSAYFVGVALMLAIVLIFAEITYRFIEKPGINLGLRYIKSRRQK